MVTTMADDTPETSEPTEEDNWARLADFVDSAIGRRFEAWQASETNNLNNSATPTPETLTSVTETPVIPEPVKPVKHGFLSNLFSGLTDQVKEYTTLVTKPASRHQKKPLPRLRSRVVAPR